MTEEQNQEEREEREKQMSNLSTIHDIATSYPLRARVKTCALLIANIRLSKKQRRAWMWEAATCKEWVEAWQDARHTEPHYFAPIGWRGDVISDRMIQDFVRKMLAHSREETGEK